MTKGKQVSALKSIITSLILCWIDDARPMATAPTDGTEVWILTSAVHGLPMIEGKARYHLDAGWCVDELREAIAWRPIDA